MPIANRIWCATFALAALGAATIVTPSAAATQPNVKASDVETTITSLALQASALPLSRPSYVGLLISVARTGFQLFSAQSRATAASPDLDTIKTGSTASSFFATMAIPFSPIGSSKDWDRVRSAEPVSTSTKCETLSCSNRLDAVTKAINSKENTGFFGKLSAVNALVNRSVTYAADRKVYGSLDHWASGAETMRIGAGDCEDFAILKLSILREMGVPTRSMSLVVLRDTARDLYHAVLAVSTNKGHFILDNVRNEVYRDVAVSHYMPLYSFSDDRSWIHGKPTDNRIASATRDMRLGSIAPGESRSTAVDVVEFSIDLNEEIRPAATF